MKYVPVVDSNFPSKDEILNFNIKMNAVMKLTTSNKPVMFSIDDYTFSDGSRHVWLHLRNKTCTSVAIYDVLNDAFFIGRPNSVQDLENVLLFCETLREKGYTKKHFENLIPEIYEECTKSTKCTKRVCNELKDVLSFFHANYLNMNYEKYLNQFWKDDTIYTLNAL